MTTVSELKGHDSFLSKLDTFKRRKKAKQEIEELTKESRQAIESAVNVLSIEDPKEYQLEEGEERSFIEKSSQYSDSVQNLIIKLISWINNELSDQRILVRDIQEDIFDGQLLQKLVEKLTGIKLDHPELTQSEIGQLQRLRSVLNTINEILHVSDMWADQCWTAEKIQQKDLIAILRLLVALARHFKPEIHFQPGVFITLIIARKLNGSLEYRHEREYITEPTEHLKVGNPLDLISNNEMVCRTLTDFVNYHLSQVGIRITNISKDFSDGVFLILLMGLIEGYFVPLHFYHPNPKTEAMRITNVKLAFELMEAAGIVEVNTSPEEIVAADTNAILRVLYNLHCYVTNANNNNNISESNGTNKNNNNNGNDDSSVTVYETNDPQRFVEDQPHYDEQANML